MIAYEPLIGRKEIGEAEKKTSTKVSRKSNSMVGRMLRGRWAPCSV